jgi:hypothetical protein
MDKMHIFFAVFFGFILFSGCMGPEPGGPQDGGIPQGATPNGSQGEVPPGAPQNDSGAEEPQEEAFEPFYFSYLLDSPLMGRGWDQASIIYYFEKERDCGGEPAYLGVAKSQGEGPSGLSWMKTTLYTDDVSLAMSDNMDTSSLTFDDAVPRRVQVNIPFFLHDIFLQGGLSAPEEWSIGDVLIARGVMLFTSERYEVSIAYVGEGEASGIPCSNVSLGLKAGGGNPVPLEVCEATIEGLPVTVYFNLDAGEGSYTRWSLEEYGQGSSGTPVYHQCMDLVSCPPEPDTSSVEAECSSSDGAVYMLMNRDNCYVGAVCLSKDGAYAHVSDENGESVAGLEVCAWEGEEPEQPSACVYTDSDGFAHFAGFEAENYILTYNALTFPSEYIYDMNRFSCTYSEGGPFVCEIWVDSK